MTGVTWSIRSRRDLRRAFDYFLQIDADLALRIVGLIEGKAAWLVDFPGVGTPIELGLRKVRVAGTPYLVVYREQRSGGIAIARIHHAAEDWRQP